MFNKGSERQEDLGLNVYQTHYRILDPVIGRWWQEDPKADIPSQIELTPYNFGDDDPVAKNDPNGDCPWCIIGAAVGGIVSGAIEAGSQLIEHGEVNDWSAVGGSVLQGAITGGVAAATGGASLLVTTATSVASNVVGGALSNAVQGKQITGKSIAKDALVGLGGVALNKAAGAAINKLSPTLKGKIGEAATQIKYLSKGYLSEGKSIVATGAKTATGKVQVAKYDHAMKNVLTGRRLTVESKFNNAVLTGNQKAAASRVTTSGGLVIDRTTSGQLGSLTGGIGAGSISGQIKKN